MITERDKRLAELRTYVDADEPIFSKDGKWLLDEIERLDKELERIHDDAVQAGIERDLNT